MTRRIQVKGHYRIYNGKKKWIESFSREISSKKTSNKTMFFPPHYNKYAEMIEMDDPESALVSVRKLKREFNQAKTHNKKLVIVKATQLAENRASAQLGRENLSSKEQSQFRKIKKIYGETADSFWKKI